MDIYLTLRAYFGLTNYRNAITFRQRGYTALKTRQGTKIHKENLFYYRRKPYGEHPWPNPLYTTGNFQNEINKPQIEVVPKPQIEVLPKGEDIQLYRLGSDSQPFLLRRMPSNLLLAHSIVLNRSAQTMMCTAGRKPYELGEDRSWAPRLTQILRIHEGEGIRIGGRQIFPSQANIDLTHLLSLYF